ncbi:MAG: hypothetical protein NVS4B11_33280 [Ktedonobacteraceae bacterium]
MAKKKNTKISVSQEDSIQAKPILEHYHQLAENLRSSPDQRQVEAVLSEINTLPERVQMALLKALAKEHHSDGADVLTAINELGPMKEVRKEARRALIQLEGAGIYPQWKPAVPQPLAAHLSTTPLRFWKGVVTDSRNLGEVQLVLCWEQDSDEIRVLSFLLDFWQDGVKDFFTRVGSRRNAEKLIDSMSDIMPDVKVKACSLAQGRRLLLDALASNKQHGTTPHRDYRNNISLVNHLILEVPDLNKEEVTYPEVTSPHEREDVVLDDAGYYDLDELDEDDEELDLQSLEPQQVVAHFVNVLFDEADYERAYDLLAKESPLREGLAQEVWVERREEWAEEADPSGLEPGIVHEREQQKSGLWLPFAKPRPLGDRKEIETFWSAEVEDVSSDMQLPELPSATAVYEETQRHWFWATYVLVQEEGAWRIESMSDEAINAQGLTIEELQKRIRDLDKYLEDFSKKHKPADIQRAKEEDLVRYTEEIYWRLMRSVGYSDALIKKLPLDHTLYEEAAGRMILVSQLERCLVYLEARAYRFEEQRGSFLRRAAEVQQHLAKKYRDVGNTEQAEHLQELAEKALEESLTIEDSFEAHVSLAELLIEENRLDEAEAHLLQAKALTSDSSQEAHAEMHLGEIATEREQYEEALSHYQRVTELEPDLSDSWSDLADVYDHLGNLDEAETHYRHAMELDPDDSELYAALAHMYGRHEQRAKVIEILEEGLSVHPDAAVLYVYLASTYMEAKDYRRAEQYLEKAERLEPDLGIIYMFRQTLNLLKAQAGPPQIGRLGNPGKKKKKR